MTNPPAGWHPDPRNLNGLRYWDGNDWTDHTAPRPTTNVSTSYVPVRTNHTFHLLMTVFTCGLWGIVWAFVAFTTVTRHNRSGRSERRDDEQPCHREQDLQRL